jgi:hypothetical protein
MNQIHNVLAAFALCVAAGVQGQNILANPGFESQGSSWSLWKEASATTAAAAITYPTTGVHSGTRYARVEVTEPAEQNWHIQLQLPYQWSPGIGATYELKFWAKSDSSRSIHVGIHDGEATSYAYRGGMDFDLTPAWAEYSLTYTSDVEGNANLRFNLYLGAAKDIYGFDDFSLVALTAGVRAGAGANDQALRVRREPGNLVLSLDGVSENWKAELLDLRGISLASAMGGTDGSLRLALPGKNGTYLIRASTPTRSWVRKVPIP